jgi:TP901 family phage tail tape measure protein
LANKITTVFDAENKGLKTAIAQGQTEFQKLQKAAASQSQAIAKSWGNMAQSVGTALQRVSAAGALAFGAATKFASDFGKSMANVNSIALQSEDQFKKTTQAVLGLNHEIGTAQSPKLLASALYDINSAGFSGAEGLKVLKAAAIGADAGQAAAAVVADGLTTELRAFGLEAEESERVLDMMLKTVQRGKVTMEQYSSNIGQIASDSKQAKVTQEELHGSIALLTAKTGQAAQSFTRFQALVKALSLPPTEARAAYEKMGLQFGSSAIEANGLVGQLQKMREAANGNEIAFAQMLGGSQEAISAANILLGDDNGASALLEISEAAKAAGTTQAAFAEQAKAAAFQFQKLSSTLQAAAITFGNAIAPAVGKVADVLQSVVTKFNQLDPALKNTIAVGAAAGTVLAGLAGTALTLAPGIAAVVTALSAPAGVAFIASVKALGVALASFVTGPVAVAAAAVGALYLAWKNDLGGIQEKVSEWGKEISGAMSEVADFFGRQYERLEGVTREAWATIKPIAISAMEIIEQRVFTFGRAIVDAASVAWELFSGAASVAWEAIKGIVDIQIGVITTLLEAGTAVLNGNWGKAWDLMVAGTNEALEKVGQLVLKVLEKVGQMVWDAGTELYAGGKNLARNLKEGAAQELELFKQTVSEALGFSVRQTEVFGEAAERQTRTAFQNMLSHAETFKTQFAAKMEEALAPLRAFGGQVDEAFSGVKDSLSSVFKPLGGLTGIFGNKSSGSGGGSGGGGGTEPKPSAGKTSGKTDAELIAEIRKGADVRGNVSFEGAKRDLLEAVAKFVENAARDGLRPVISSVTDGRHAPNSYHYAGEAIDFGYYRPDGGLFSPDQELALGKKHLQGTGFKGMLDELLGGSPHLHAALGTGDSGDSRFNLIETGFQKVVEDQKRQNAAVNSLIKDFQVETIEQADLIFGMFEESAKQSEALMAQIKDNRISDQAKMALGLAGGGEDPLYGGLGAAFGSAEDMAAADQAEIDRVRALEEAKYQERLRRHQLEMELGYLEAEEHAAWLQQMAQADGLSTEQRLQREAAYHQAKRGLEQQTFNYVGQLQQAMANSFSQFLNATLTGQQTFSQGIKQLWRSIFNQIISMLVQAIVKATILNSLMGFFSGGLGNVVRGIFGGGGGGGAIISDTPGIAGAVTAHSGERYVTADPLSRYLQGTGDLGAGEALRVLQTGEQVLSRRDARQQQQPAMMGGGTIHIGEVHNHDSVDLDMMSKSLAWRQLAYGRMG